jgi:hypothetical protein
LKSEKGQKIWAETNFILHYLGKETKINIYKGRERNRYMGEDAEF